MSALAYREHDGHALLAREVAAINPSSILARSGPLIAFVARADEIPLGLQEIGRLRPGSGVDLDWFDLHYLHFVAWNSERREIVGAYRCGAADAIVRHYGVDGLFTASRFVYEKLLVARLRRGLELSRAFVRQEYQNTHVPLFLLWRAIAEFTARNPRYKLLFGTVSIGNGFRPETEDRIVDFLYGTSHAALVRLVRPREPLTSATSRRESPADLESLEREIRDLEGEERSLPVLLRQCVKLGARLLSVAKDVQANQVDALVLVDLSTAPLEALAGYMANEGMRAFVRHRGGPRFRGLSLERRLRRMRPAQT